MSRRSAKSFGTQTGAAFGAAARTIGLGRAQRGRTLQAMQSWQAAGLLVHDALVEQAAMA